MLLRRVNDWPAWAWSSPFEDLERMRRQMDRFRGDLPRGLYGPTSPGGFPLMNMSEDKDSYYVRAELPGLKADDLEISVTGDTFSISGERKMPLEDENARYHRREREAGRFSRLISLPAQIDPGKVEALCRDGVLTVTLPKAEETKPKQITVKGS